MCRQFNFLCYFARRKGVTFSRTLQSRLRLDGFSFKGAE